MKKIIITIYNNIRNIYVDCKAKRKVRHLREKGIDVCIRK